MAAVRVVSLGEILAEPGRRLDADYWCEREPGESAEQYEARKAVEAAEYRVRLAEHRLDVARRRLDDAKRQTRA